MKIKTKIKIIASLLIAIFLFVTVSVLVKQNISYLRELIEDNFTLGIFIFILLEIVSIVLAPVTSLPLLPLASNTYGILLSSIFYIIGGIIGSVIAFHIGRKFKAKILGKMVSLEETKLVKDAIPKKHHFHTLILMRIIIPADILSYALGIATNIGYGIFILTTIIGIIPSAFFFSYLGVLPLIYQIIGWTLGIIVLVIFFKILLGKRQF